MRHIIIIFPLYYYFTNAQRFKRVKSSSSYRTVRDMVFCKGMTRNYHSDHGMVVSLTSIA